MKRLLLIDGMSTAYRAFFAIRNLRTSRGQPTNAVFGFIKMLRKMLREYRPDYVAIAADSKGATFRHEKFKDYKAQRRPIPEDLESQLPLIKQAAEGYRIPWLALTGYEADDILATLAIRAAAAGIETFILTGDKDLLQLVNDRIKVISPHQDGVLYDRGAVEEHYGVPPAGMPDVLALMGDGIDNIPGIPGIGEKTAIKLINEYHSLEEVLKHAGAVKNKRVSENLVKFRDQARLSRELVRLDAGVPVAPEWEEMLAREPDRPKLMTLFAGLEFRNLLTELSAGEETEISWQVFSGPGAVASLREKLSGAEEFALQIRADGRDFMKARLRSLAFSLKKGEGMYLPLRGAEKTKILEGLAPLLADEERKKIVHDAKFAWHVFKNEGVDLKGVVWDTMLASYLLNPSRPEHTLESLSADFLGSILPSPPGEGTEEKLSLEEENSSGRILCLQAATIRELKALMAPEMEPKQLLGLLGEMELPLSQVLARMERNGITLDREKLGRMSLSLEKELNRLSREMFSLAGEEFNLNSPQQLGKILFEKLRLPPQKKTKTGYSTDVRVLQKLAAHHELPARLLTFRQLSKLKSTYLDALPALINRQTGRIHTTLHQEVTSTGRLSSSDPNLQNIPIRTDLGKEIRTAFIPAPGGWKLLSADYSQIDLRVLAHLSGDPLLREAFAREEDVHAFTASQIFGVPIGEVTPEMRRRAKTVNFGVIYGMGAYGLSEDLGISLSEADEFIRAYFKRYKGVQEYTQATIRKARELGYVTTIFNRRRYLPELESQQDSVRRFGERIAINTPVQGSAADIIKLAMIAIDRKLREEGFIARMLLQIHDELLFEAPPDELPGLGRLVTECMGSVIRLEVPLKTDVKAGENWGELKAVIDN